MSVKKYKTPNKEIQALKAKIRDLENEKKVLNVAIDLADEIYSTDIRKKHLALSLERLKQQSQV